MTPAEIQWKALDSTRPVTSKVSARHRFFFGSPDSDECEAEAAEMELTLLLLNCFFPSCWVTRLCKCFFHSSRSWSDWSGSPSSDPSDIVEDTNTASARFVLLRTGRGTGTSVSTPSSRVGSEVGSGGVGTPMRDTFRAPRLCGLTLLSEGLSRPSSKPGGWVGGVGGTMGRNSSMPPGRGASEFSTTLVLCVDRDLTGSGSSGIFLEEWKVLVRRDEWGDAEQRGVPRRGDS
mmetsp:Transcript_85131/g.264491  ORF Transcript_85131/g.264491 Transcript_85131/m.264491 type:complete len:233 (+) Transcript_85131:1791-2489(+)